jgi:hypothetical protein
MTNDSDDKASLLVYGLLAAGGAIVIAAGGLLHYQTEPPLPPAPPAEKKPEARTVGMAMGATPEGYKAIVTEDARRFGVGVDVSQLAEPFPYHVEFEGSHRLVGRDSLDTPHLQIGARIEKQWANMGGNQGFGADQFLLTVKNKTGHALAYRIQTEVPDRRACRMLGATPHNAIALRPAEELTRTECLWGGHGFFVAVRRVEIMEIPALSYYYLSRLHPPHVLYEERTSEGHQAPIGKPCELVPWRDIQVGEEQGDVSWADVVDFYARHNCDEYTFFRGYRRRNRAADPLPVLPPPKTGSK